jgi:hypothetical protein
MSRVRPIWLGVAAVMAVSAPAADAADVKLSGSLRGTKLPKRSAGVSLLQAMNLSDGTITATQYLSRRGRFSVKVPPGPYGLLAGSVFFKKKRPTVKLVGALLAKSGKSRRLPLSLRRSASQPIVGVNYFTGGAYHQNHGFADLVETDLFFQIGKPCQYTLVELKRRAEVVSEIRRQQTKYYDPASRVKVGLLKQPTAVVNGSVTGQGDDLSYNVRVVDSRTGKVKGTVSGRTTGGDWVKASGDIAEQLAKIICQPDEVHFRIVGYTKSEQSSTSHGQRTAQDALTGPGPVSTIPPCSDPNPANCSKFFLLEGTVLSTFTGHVSGTANPITCPGGSFDYGTSTIPNNMLRLVMSFDPNGTAPATMGAGTIPEVGDVVEDKCGAHDSGDSQGFSASVSAADLMSGNPVTFSFSGQGSVPSAGDHPGIPVNWMFSETLTVQRVNADGSHI